MAKYSKENFVVWLRQLKKCLLLTKNYEMLKNIKPSPIYFEFAKNEKDFRNAVADIFLQI